MKRHVPSTVSVLVAAAALLATVLGPAVPGTFAATLTLPTLIRDHMVLQREARVPIWGTAAPGSSVTVRFDGQAVSATAAATGRWRINLAPMPATRSSRTMTITSDGQALTLADVQVGEVWLCSGQSNMELRLDASIGGAAAAADAPNHDIRLFSAAWTTTPGQVTWTVSDAATASAFSAVCYYYGRELSQRLRIPIGLIQSTKSGTYIEEWTHATGGSCSSMLLARRTVPTVTGHLYESKIRPLMPYAIRGVTWYQGENDSRDCAAVYLRKLEGLIREWRVAWGEGAFPFGVVQLPFGRTPATQAAQLQVFLTIPNTFLAVTADLPILGGTDLHPANKRPIGVRLAIGARSIVYGEPIEPVGPIVDPSGSYVSGNTVVARFSHTGAGLVTGSTWEPAGAPAQFWLARATGGFHPATAIIVGDTVRLTYPAIKYPARVRYVWTYGRGNLYSRVRIAIEGGRLVETRLPAAPFELVFTPSGYGQPPTPL